MFFYPGDVIPIPFFWCHSSTFEMFFYLTSHKCLNIIVIKAILRLQNKPDG